MIRLLQEEGGTNGTPGGPDSEASPQYPAYAPHLLTTVFYNRFCNDKSLGYALSLLNGRLLATLP